jgi:phosphoserine aminotransferase
MRPTQPVLPPIPSALLLPLETIPMQPTVKPQNPNFSSGPCAKRPGYDVAALQLDVLGRSHRSALGKKALGLACTETARLLGLPEGYRVAVVPASDTGAVEMAMWSLLGPRGVDVLAWESFGSGWVTDIVKQLKLPNVTKREAGYGDIVDLSTVNFDNDVVFTWNGTTSGVKVPTGDWIPADRAGLTICDATSAVFAMDTALGQARRDHLLLAEGAGRRRRARHADPEPARGAAPGELQPALAPAQDVSA